MEKRLERIIEVLRQADKPLSKVELRQLETKANRSKLRELLGEDVIKRNKVVVPIDTKVVDAKLEQAKLIRNDKKRETVINKINADANKEKFYYTYELV